MQDKEKSMLDDRPDSDYMLVAATNISIYCFLVDLPVGHKLDKSISMRPYIEDVYPPSKENLCLFNCILKKLRPDDSQKDRSTRAKLMWCILIAS